MSSPKRILMLYWYPVPLRKMRLAIKQHIQVLDNIEHRYKVEYHNVYRNTRRLRNSKFDVVILHNTFLCMRWSRDFYRLKSELEWVKQLDCLKIAIPQDEYDHSEVLDEWLFEWKISIIFSCFDAAYYKTLYPLMVDKAHFYKCLTGYIDDSFAMRIQPNLRPVEQRPNHIVYRATKLPYWFGSHGQLKHRIAGTITQHAKLHDLEFDISTQESDTIVGGAWIDFLASGKAVIGCESGSSVLDRRGEVKSKIQSLIFQNGDLSFDDVNAHFPNGWDDYKFFAISPRHLESVITKTCQVLIEGKYDGILKPNDHYIPLKRDFSNVDDVLEKLKDSKLLQHISDQAYEEMHLSRKYSYSKFALEMESSIFKFQ